jgi:hypothetical protein
MAMKVYNTFEHDINHFIKECVHLFHNKQLEGNLSLCFCIQIFRKSVNIAFQLALTSPIKMKIVLVGEVCSKPPITIRSHDLHVGDIRGATGEIVLTMRGTSSLPSFWFLRVVRLLAFLWPSFFVSSMMVTTIVLLLDLNFCYFLK